MDVCGDYPKDFGTWAAILLGQVVVTNVCINGTSGTYNAQKEELKINQYVQKS